MFDASAFSGCWAFRNNPARDLPGLCRQLAQEGIKGAAISPVEGILQPEPMTANRLFLKEVAAWKDSSFTVYPVPIVDPSLPDWQEQIAQCAALRSGRIAAYKLLPGYHGYDFNLPALHELALMLEQQGTTLCVQLRMEDERSRHSTVNVPAVSPGALKEFAATHPGLEILACSPYMAELAAISSAPNISVEMSCVESGHTLHDALQRVGSTRLLVGTHAPLYMPAVGVCKAFADTVASETRELVVSGNFKRLFAQ